MLEETESHCQCSVHRNLQRGPQTILLACPLGHLHHICPIPNCGSYLSLGVSLSDSEKTKKKYFLQRGRYLALHIRSHPEAPIDPDTFEHPPDSATGKSTGKRKMRAEGGPILGKGVTKAVPNGGRSKADANSTAAPAVSATKQDATQRQRWKEPWKRERLAPLSGEWMRNAVEADEEELQLAEKLLIDENKLDTVEALAKFAVSGYGRRRMFAAFGSDLTAALASVSSEWL